MAQLVAHHTGSVGVTGSNPVSSTMRALILIQSERPFVLPERAVFWLVGGGFLRVAACWVGVVGSSAGAPGGESRLSEKFRNVSTPSASKSIGRRQKVWGGRQEMRVAQVRRLNRICDLWSALTCSPWGGSYSHR